MSITIVRRSRHRSALLFPRLCAIVAVFAIVPTLLCDDTPGPKVAQVLQPFVESHTLAGAVVLVADAERVLAVEAVGSMDLAAQKPMRTDCMFWIASQSKPITGAALMILVDEGRVNVEDPVEKYLPEFRGQQLNGSADPAKPELRAPRHPILVREVLSHTSGLPFKSDIEEPTLDVKPLAERVRSYARTPLLFEPGAQSKYSNAGINTAGRIVEVVSGMPFECFLEERLFKPLGMIDTTFLPSKAQLARLAKSYKPNAAKDGLEECEINQLRYPLDAPERQPMPAGGLFSTAQDLSIFYLMLANNGVFQGTRVLSAKSVEQMTSDQSGEAKSAYGFGIGTNGRIVTHGGAYNSMSRFDREHRLITIFLGQHAGWIKDGKSIIPAFQKAATEAFGKGGPAKPGGTDVLQGVGIPGQTPPRPPKPEGVGTGALTNTLGMQLVRIESGGFLMGQDGPTTDYFFTKHPEQVNVGEWDERPTHRVTISAPFHMGATEVTLGQYRQFQPKHQLHRKDDEAATEVSWQDAVDFCRWLSGKEGRTYRLPTEAEWEYACRAGTTTLFSSGDSLPAASHRWFRDQNYRAVVFADARPMPAEYQPLNEIPTLRVAQSPANPWGLFDMHGNVAEWCLDWYGPYEAAAQTDPLGRTDSDFRVFRGGSHSTLSYLLRSANRSAWIPESRDPGIGFRVVLGDAPKGSLLPSQPAPRNAQAVVQGVPMWKMPSADIPFFDGPKGFVKIPDESVGPLFSRHNHSPAVTECPNGDLLATWFSCVLEQGAELCNIASRLRFGSADWEEASPFWDGPDVNDHAPKLWWDGEKTLFHFARGLNENIVRTSVDNGATWSKARVLQPHGELGNQLLRLRDGTLVISHDSRTVSLVTSRDAGRTWSANQFPKRESGVGPGSTAQRYPGIHAPLVELADGRLMAFSRNDPLPDQERFGFMTPVAFTSDLGKSWQVDASEFPAVTSGQRQVLLRLREGPLLLCSFTDQGLNWKSRKGLPFKAADGTEFKGYGLFAAVSFDDGKTWPARRLITPGGGPRQVPGTDGRGMFTLSDTMAEIGGYLTAVQTRDGHVQLLSSRNHYTFNLAWLKTPPPAPPASNKTR